MKKRIIAIVLTMIHISLSVAFTGCSRNTDNQLSEQDSLTTMVFKLSRVSLQDDYEISAVCPISYADEKIHCLVYSSGHYDEAYAYSLDSNGENGELRTVEPVNLNSFVYWYYALQGGEYFTVEPVYDTSDTISDLMMSLRAYDDLIIFSVTLNSLFGNGTYLDHSGHSELPFAFHGVHCVSEGEYMIVTSLGAVIVNSDGSTLYIIIPEAPLSIQNFTVTSSGEIVAFLTDDPTGRRTSQTKLGIINTSEKKISYLSDNTISDFLSYKSQFITGTGLYNLYFTSTFGLYGVRVDGNTISAPVRVVDWVRSGIDDAGMVYDIYSVSGERFIAKIWNSESLAAEIQIFDMIPKDELTERSALVLAHGSPYFSHNSEVSDFSKLGYDVEVRDYSKYILDGDYTKGVQMIVNEIVAGDIPDLLFDNLSSHYFTSLMRMGAFADLYPYLDSDSDVSRDTLVSAVREPFEYNGKLYYLATGFVIYAYLGRQSDIPYDTWSYEKAFEKMDSLDDGAVLSNNVYSWSNTGGDDGEWGISGYLFEGGFDDFIDYGNATVSFNSEFFLKILEKIRETKDKVLKTGAFQAPELLREVYLTGIDNYMGSRSSLERDGEEIIVVPYPTIQEQSISDAGGIIQASSRLYMMDNGVNKESAWEFMKYIMSDEVQMKAAEQPKTSAFPITENAMKAYLEKSAQIYEKSDGLSEEEMVAEAKKTEADIDLLKHLLSNSKARYPHDPALYRIVAEEILTYTMNEKISAGQTAEAIQSRANIYISETHG